MPMDFPALLTSAMAARRMTQVALAALLGSSQPTISAWMAGRAVPAPATVFAVEAALGLSPGYLSGALGYVPVGTETLTPEEHVLRSTAWDLPTRIMLVDLMAYLRDAEAELRRLQAEAIEV